MMSALCSPATAIVLAVTALAGCGHAGDRLSGRVSAPGRTPVGGCNPAAASSWPGAIHDARHTSAAAVGVVGPQTGHIKWEHPMEGNVTPGPALGPDGTVYAASNAGKLHALDPNSGADRWVFDAGTVYGSDLSTTPSVLSDGTILWPGPADTLFALDPQGHLLWREAFGAFVLSPADRRDGRVYVMDMAGTLTALDVSKATRKSAWAIRLGRTSYGSPAIAPDGTVIATVDADVVAVVDRGGAGVVSWRWRAPATIEVSPAVAPDGTVVVGPNDDYAYGITSEGTLRWRWRKGDWSYSSAAVTPDGRAFFGDHLGFLDILEASTGALVRRLATLPKSEPHPGGVGIWTSPAVDAQGNVYFGTVAGHIYGFGPDGRQLFDFDTGATVDSYPALGPDGTLYIGSGNGRLYALAGQARPPVPTTTPTSEPKVKRCLPSA